MRNVFKSFRFLTCAILLSLSFMGCDEEFSTINGNGVLGDNNLNFVTDSLELPIVAYNKKLDAVQINNLPSYLLGVFNQTDYGKTTASIISQIEPDTNSLLENFGQNPVVESVIINIPYFSTVTGVSTANSSISLYRLDSLYGNNNAPIKLSIYQNNYFLRDFDQSGNASAVQRYYSKAEELQDPSRNFALDGTQLIDFDANLGDLIYENLDFSNSNQAIALIDNTDVNSPITTYGAPALRIRLEKSVDSTKLAIWQRAINDLADGVVLNNANAFKNYFRGLYFKAEAITGDGSMVLLNLAARIPTAQLAQTGANFNTAGANITINYTKGLEGSRTEDSYVLNFSGNRLNTFQNEFTAPLVDGDEVNGDETLYLKGMEGSLAVVDLFPTEAALEDFKSQFLNADGTQKKLLNEAQLVINESAALLSNPIENGNAFHKYDRIYAFDVETNTILLDAGIDPSANNNDPLSSRTLSLGQRDESGQYIIRVTDFLNNIITNGSTNYKIGLVVSTNVNVTVNSSILNSDDAVTSLPSASIISPRGTILHGSNTSQLNDEKRLKLKLFFTKPKEN